MLYLIYILLLSSMFGVGLDKDSRIIDEEVSMIEYNHVYHKNNGHIFDQVILYHCYPETGKFHVRDFFLIRADRYSKPPLNTGRGYHTIEYIDEYQKIVRRIKSRIYKETWTNVDPEQEDKKYVDDHLRYRLIRPPLRKGEEENFDLNVLTSINIFMLK